MGGLGPCLLPLHTVLAAGFFSSILLEYQGIQLSLCVSGTVLGSNQCQQGADVIDAGLVCSFMNHLSLYLLVLWR